MTLYLRTVDANRRAHGGFQWPSEIGARVEAPNWHPTSECGNGLHGLPWGEGDASLLNNEADAIWQVVEYDGPDAIDLGGKSKFPWCVLRYDGDRDGAIGYLIRSGAAGKAVVFANVVAGHRGIATAGDHGTATAGDYGTATAGDYGIATAGGGGTATAGDYGTATAGDSAIATAGDHGTATAGYRGTATAGDYGEIRLRWHDGIRYRTTVLYVGEAGIEPNTLYRLDTKGRPVEVTK